MELRYSTIAEELSGIDDLGIIELAKKTDLIIITEDKDFGEWVFAHKVKNISVIFLRYHIKDLPEMIATIVKVVQEKGDDLKGHFTTITTKKIRIRKI